jgi:hypothetical protein
MLHFQNCTAMPNNGRVRVGPREINIPKLTMIKHPRVNTFL